MKIQDIKLTGIILAGGKSLRMGEDKSLLKIGDKTFLEIIYETIAPFCTTVFISTNNPEITLTGVRSISDEIKDIGPLSGIYTCLKKSDTNKNLIVTTDTPLINEGLIRYLILESGNNDVTFCEYNEKENPLIGIYSKNFIKFAKLDIDAKKHKTIFTVYKSKYKKLMITKDHSFFKSGLFLNINSPEDLIRLKKLRP